MNVPAELSYTDEHEWIEATDDGTIRVGITEYAQDQLGDVVFVELPSVGAEVEEGEMLAEVESTKSVAEVYAPVAGTVETVNDVLVDTPELVNQSPYGDGWFVTMRRTSAFAPEAFLDAAAYRALID